MSKPGRRSPERLPGESDGGNRTLIEPPGSGSPVSEYRDPAASGGRETVKGSAAARMNVRIRSSGIAQKRWPGGHFRTKPRRRVARDGKVRCEVTGWRCAGGTVRPGWPSGRHRCAPGIECFSGSRRRSRVVSRWVVSTGRGVAGQFGGRESKPSRTGFARVRASVSNNEIQLLSAAAGTERGAVALAVLERLLPAFAIRLRASRYGGLEASADGAVVTGNRESSNLAEVCGDRATAGVDS